jgi:hypothetical protein
VVAQVVPEDILRWRQLAVDYESEAIAQGDHLEKARSYLAAARAAGKAGDRDNAVRLAKEVERVANEARDTDVIGWDRAQGAWYYLRSESIKCSVF